ncbi:MAG: cell division protein FtsH, partial [Anaerolineae bacterium]|nr:cell division protein FtsH [Anaerolineae bacterium]
MRNGFLYLILLAVLAVFLFTTLRQSRDTVDVVSISQVAADVQAGKVKQLSEKDGEVDVTYRDEATAAVTSRIEQDNFDLVKTLHSLGVTDEQMAGVVVEFKPTSRWENLAPVLFAFLPIVLIALFFFFILRQAQGAGNQAFSFGKSKARVFTGDKPTVTFDDVAGAEESKEELKEVVEFLKEPQKFAALGARIPKGVLLVGP